MFKLLLLGIGLAVFMIGAAYVLAKKSQDVPPQLQAKDRFQKCPDKPNCVSTEEDDLLPIVIGTENHQAIWDKLQQTVSEQGGNLKEIQPHYLWATFKSPIFGFVDDLEAKLAPTENVIHLRSASRVGYYDFGANRKRLLNLKAKMQVYLNLDQLKNTHE
ncbi:MAG: DUF1499 domain-containing protein [Gammaproteobacteria bacterium]